MIAGLITKWFNLATARLRSTRRWPWFLAALIVVLSEIFTLIMNSINSLIWYGRIDRDLLLIGTIDAFAVSIMVGLIAIFLIKHAFSLENVNRRLQEQIEQLNRAERQRRELEEQLARARKMEAVGTLAGGVAHDLNNILSGLVTYPDLLLMEIPEDSWLHSPLLTIKSSGERAAAVVQDLLALARRGCVSEAMLNFNDIITQYKASLEFQALQANHPRVGLVTSLAMELPSIKGSAVHLGRALMNLVTNAFEAMPSGGTVAVSSENLVLERLYKGYEVIPAGDYVVIGVADKGPGIDRRHLESIFEPFYTKKAMGRSGTGLGLAVVWGTVKDHGGYIDVTSGDDAGTLFRLFLPAAGRPVPGEAPTASIDDYRSRGETILVVDDIEEQRLLAGDILGRLGYRVHTVQGGREAVDFCKTTPVDLVVLDMIMDPGMDGLETYQQILACRPGQKAIIASGFSETDRVTQALALGAGAYVSKPYLASQLGQAVRRELDRK
ncbi:MAG: ATP-binding protein [Thermodesulfobacteriota bacterium]